MENKYYYDYSQGRLDTITTQDEHKVKELIDKGDAIKLDMTELNEFERRASQVHSDYTSKVERLRNTDDPRLMDEAVQKYEYDKLTQEYEEATQAIEEEYSAFKERTIAETKEKAVRSAQVVTDRDKHVAESFATNAMLDLAESFDTSVAVNKIVADIGLLTDDERYAMRSEITRLTDRVDDPIQKRKLLGAVRNSRNEDTVAHEIAKQLPYSVAYDYRIRKTVEKVSDSGIFHKDNGEAMSSDFYKKHIKKDSAE